MTTAETHTPAPGEHIPSPDDEKLFEVWTPKEYKYEILSDNETRTKYVNLTEKLIANTIDRGDDYLVFLDKSARPVAWLMRDLWPTLGIDDGGDPIQMPEIRFANIDREQWADVIGRSEDEDGGAGIMGVSQERINQLHNTFELTSSHDDEKTKVHIVDEVMASGDTLRMAMGLFGRAFPEAQINGSHWMTPETKTLSKGARINADQPIWYDSEEIKGRLVGNRNDPLSAQSSSSAQREGSRFLSTRFRSPDQKGLQLKREMKQLALEVANGFVPVTPSSIRSIEAQDHIVETINGLSIDEYVALKRESNDSGQTFLELFTTYKASRSKAARSSHPSADNTSV